MRTRSIFTVFILFVTTTQAWAQSVQDAPGPAWRPAGLAANNGVVPAAATGPAPFSPSAPAFTAPAAAGARRASTRSSLRRPP